MCAPDHALRATLTAGLQEEGLEEQLEAAARDFVAERVVVKQPPPSSLWRRSPQLRLPVYPFHLFRLDFQHPGHVRVAQYFRSEPMPDSPGMQLLSRLGLPPIDDARVTYEPTDFRFDVLLAQQWEPADELACATDPAS